MEKKSRRNQDWIRFTPLLVLGAAFGVVMGLGFYTFFYAKGYSYISNNPNACANCHVMTDQLDAWVKSTHHAVTTCNSCHTPSNFFGKAYTKARNGFFHSYYFTVGGFHEPIQINDFNRRIVENNCRSCHSDIVQAMDGPHRNMHKLACISCHGSVGHPN